MLRMTFPALCIGVELVHPAVGSLNIFQLGRDVRVADYTPVIHGLGFPR
jgi:hypothetical protein